MHCIVFGSIIREIHIKISDIEASKETYHAIDDDLSAVDCSLCDNHNGHVDAAILW
tara:strand:+ start:422 stop:589 length:168 start_codon:yes stop_codon:yes gene_type:complete